MKTTKDKQNKHKTGRQTRLIALPDCPFGPWEMKHNGFIVWQDVDIDAFVFVDTED